MWQERGVTITCNGRSKCNTVNFLIYSHGITVYNKSVDVLHLLYKDGEYYFKLMKKIVV